MLGGQALGGLGTALTSQVREDRAGGTPERGNRLGSGDQAPARGSAECLHHRKRLTAYLWFGGPAAAPPRRCSRSRRLGCWGLDSARVGFHPFPPRGGVTAASPCALSPGPLGTMDQTARSGVWCGVGWGDGAGTHLGRDPGKGVGEGEGSASASSHLGLDAPGRPLLASLLCLWEEARLPQNADLDEMVFYGDLLKRGEIPVKDLQLSKHRVCPAAARAQSPESASPERVPPPRLRAPAIPGLDQSTPREKSPGTGTACLRSHSQSWTELAGALGLSS